MLHTIIWFEENKNIVNVRSVQNWFKSFRDNCLTSFIPCYDINLLLVLPYFVVVSLQIRTKLQQVFKSVLNCWKPGIAFKYQTKLSNSFFRGEFKDPILKGLISGVVINVSAVSEKNESCYGESIRHLDMKSGEHTGVSPLIGKKVKPINNNAVRDHLLYCNYLLSFDNSSNLSHRNKKVFVRN